MDSQPKSASDDSGLLLDFQQEVAPTCAIVDRPTIDDFNRLAIVPPELGSYGYLWHPGIQMLVCLHCKTMVAPHGLKYHCNQAKHRTPEAAVIKTFMALVDVRFMKCLPELVSGQTLRPIKGLDIEDNRQCTLCPYISNVDGTMKNHVRMAHNGKWDPTLFRTIKCQTFSLAPMTRFAIENEYSISEESGDLKQLLNDSVGNIIEAMETTSAGAPKLSDAWPYLKKVSWDKVISVNRSEMSLDELYQLGHLGKSDAMDERSQGAKIHSAVTAFFANMEEGLEVGCWELRQMILAEKKGQA